MRPRYGRWRRYGGRRSKAGPTAYSGNFPVFQESPELEQLRMRLRDFNHEISSCVAKREFYVRTIATGIWIYFIYLFLANVRSSGDLLQALGSVVICAAILWLSCWKLTDGNRRYGLATVPVSGPQFFAQRKIGSPIGSKHKHRNDLSERERRMGKAGSKNERSCRA